MNCEELIDILTEYSHSFIGEGKRKFHEDKSGCHIFIITKKKMSRNITCFDEAKGLFGRFIGNKKVYCYDEYKGIKIAITLVYRLNKLRMVMLTAFKKGVDLKWPPKARKKT